MAEYITTVRVASVTLNDYKNDRPVFSGLCDNAFRDMWYIQALYFHVRFHGQGSRVSLNHVDEIATSWTHAMYTVRDALHRTHSRTSRPPAAPPPAPLTTSHLTRAAPGRVQCIERLQAAVSYEMTSFSAWWHTCGATENPEPFNKEVDTFNGWRAAIESILQVLAKMDTKYTNQRHLARQLDGLRLRQTDLPTSTHRPRATVRGRAATEE